MSKVQQNKYKDPLADKLGENNPLQQLQSSLATSSSGLSLDVPSTPLVQSVVQQGTELQKLAQIEKTTTFKKPDEAELRAMWSLVYGHIVRGVFSKGLAFYNNKPCMLKQELQLAIIRADEAVQAFIEVRNTFPDVVNEAMDKFNRMQLAQQK